jgi:hypothetical protein
VTTKTTCQPWCEQHESDFDMDECTAVRRIFPEQDLSTPPADLAALAAAEEHADTHELFPEAGSAHLKANFPRDDQDVAITLELDHPSSLYTLAYLHTDLAGLKAMHASIGEFIRELEKRA